MHVIFIEDKDEEQLQQKVKQRWVSSIFLEILAKKLMKIMKYLSCSIKHGSQASVKGVKMQKQKNVTNSSGSENDKVNQGRIYCSILTVKPKDEKETIQRQLAENGRWKDWLQGLKFMWYNKW